MRGRVDWLGRMRVSERAEGHPRRLGADGRAVAPWSTSAARIGMYLPTPRVAARGTPGRKLRCHAYAASDCHLRGRGLCESTGGPSAPPTVPLLNHTDVPMPPTDCCRSYGRFSQYRIMRLSPTRSPPYATPARDPHYQLCRHAGPRREGAARSWSRRDGPARTRPRLPAGAAGGTLRWNIIPTSPAPRQVLHEPPSERCLQQWDPVAITVVSSWIRPRGEQQLPPARSELSRRGAPLPRGQSAAASPIQPIQGDDARCWQCGAGSLWAHVEGPHSRQVRGGLRRLCSSLLDPRLHASSSVQTRPDCAVVVVGVFAARSVPHLLLPLSLAHTSACASEPPPLPSPSLVPAAVCAIAADLTRSSPCSCLW